MIDVGTCGEYKTVVSYENTAKAMKSGDLEVFATPALVAAMEAAAVNCLADYLEPGETSVGGKIDIVHTAPSVIGADITAKAEVISVSGKRLTFKVCAEDGSGIIGEGVHERFIVERAKFMSKTIIRNERKQV